MKRFALILPFLVLACGDSPAELEPDPEPDPIVELLVAQPDTGFFLGDGLALSDIVTGAVTESGEVVAVPDDLVWSVPSGFAIRNDSVVATREARGTLVVSTDVPSGVSGASIAAVDEEVDLGSLLDLSIEGPWSSTQTCYDYLADRTREGEDTPVHLDSATFTTSNGEAVYSATDWADLHKIEIAVDREVVRWWADGVIDTVTGTTTIRALQDTVSVILGTAAGPDSPRLTRVSDGPIVYRLPPPGDCSGVVAGGSAFELRAP